MKRRAAVGPARIGAGERVDTESVLEIAIRPDAFDDDDAALLAVLRLHVHDDLAALVAEFYAIALDETERRAILGVDERRRTPLALHRARRFRER